MTGRNSFCKRQRRVVVIAFLGLCVLCSGPLLALDFEALEGTARAKFVPLNHLTQEQGRRLLTRLKLATASPMPGTNALFVTADEQELRKAVAVLDVADSPEQYDVRQLSLSRSLATNQQIEAALGNISIGTFSQRAPQGSKPRALVDMHDGQILILAPVLQAPDIALAVELGPDVLARRRTNTPQADDPSVRPTAQTGAMFESRLSPQAANIAGGFSQSADASLRQDLQKRVEEIRALPAEAETRSPEIARPQLAAPRSFDAAGNPLVEGQASVPVAHRSPLPPVPAPFGQPGEAVADAFELDAGALGFEQADVLQPGQTVPAQPGRVTPAGAQVRSVPDVGSYEPNTLLDDDRVLNLNLPPRIQVIELLDLVGKYMNLTYLYDPAQITGEVTLRLNGDLRGDMKVRDLYLLLESVLKFRGLAMTRHKNNVVTIVPASEVLGVDPLLVGPGDPELQAGDVVVTRVFDLRHIDAASAKNLLEGMRVSIDVTPITERGTLIVTAYAYRMARIEQLLQMVDRPGEPREFRYRQLRYTMARSLAEKVKALAEQLESVSVTVGAPEVQVTPQQLPGETAAAYAQRLARLRATAQQQQQQRARADLGDLPSRLGVYLDADERTNRILMIGLGEQLAVVNDLVDSLDVEQQDLRSLELYRMEFVDAEEASNKLVELGIISPPLDMRTQTARLATRTGTPQAANPAAATAAARTEAEAAAARPAAMTNFTEEGLVAQPQVVVIQSTNSLLVNATPEQHTQIRRIIRYVDSEMLATEIPYQIYPLTNTSPRDLAGILQELIYETTEHRDPEGRIQTTMARREMIRIVPDPNTYSLIVYANKRNQDWISSLVQQLDKRRPQVLIDVTLVEITRSDAFNYDLNIIQSFPDLTATSGLTGGIAGDITKNTILDRLMQSGRSQFADAQWDGHRFTGFYGDKHINALLTAMQSKNYGRVLAKPKILVNDNQTGTVRTVDTTYVQKTSSIPFRSGTAGDQTDLITTAIDYAPYDAGLELNITPHISEGDLLRLVVELERSDFKPTANADKPPDTTASTISTSVTVPDGSTIILGGLIRLNQLKGDRKVPILGDLPILGGLFRSTSNVDNQSKLYVFVKAEVIRPDRTLAHGREELERLSERNRAAFERHEAEFQNYQSWPGISPRPMAPPRVLDAD